MIKTYRIGEVAKSTNVDVETIRYYESIGLIAEAARADNGYRLYTKEQLDLIHFIKRCRLFSISINEIRQLTQLLHNPDYCCNEVDQMIESHLNAINNQMREIQILQEKLISLRAKCSKDTAIKNCGILQNLLSGN